MFAAIIYCCIFVITKQKDMKTLRTQSELRAGFKTLPLASNGVIPVIVIHKLSARKQDLLVQFWTQEQITLGSVEEFKFLELL